MRNLALVALGFGLLVIQAALAALGSPYPFSPNLLLPIAIYLGVTQDVGIVRGAAISFVLGYLLDSFCGSPMGLQTFVIVATFMVARGAGLSFFARGPLFQVALTFAAGLLADGTILALRAIFERPAPFAVGNVGDSARVLIFPALVTAIVSPFIFWLVRQVDAIALRRREEAAP